MADGQKTEKATPKKRRDERKKGNVFLSNDAVSVAVLIVSMAVLVLTIPNMVKELSAMFRMCITMAGPSESQQLSGGNQLLMQMPKTVAWCVGPLLCASAAAGVVATFLQTKMLVSGEALRPKFSRINPLEGIKRLFSLRSVVEALKGLLKILILLFLIYRFLAGVALNSFARSS